jgi:anti-anti-sigma factor
VGRPGNPFAVDVRHEGGRLVLAPSGELDIATVERIRGLLDERRPGEALELDLRGLRFLDTSGLQFVVEAQRRAREEGYRLHLRPGPANVQRVFEIAGLDRVLPFEADAA